MMGKSLMTQSSTIMMITSPQKTSTHFKTDWNDHDVLFDLCREKLNLTAKKGINTWECILGRITMPSVRKRSMW